MFFQGSQIIIGTSVILTFQCLFAGCCQFLIALIEDIKEHWLELSEDAKNQSETITIPERNKIKEKLHQIIQFHGDVKELAN